MNYNPELLDLILRTFNDHTGTKRLHEDFNNRKQPEEKIDEYFEYLVHEGLLEQDIDFVLGPHITLKGKVLLKNGGFAAQVEREHQLNKQAEHRKEQELKQLDTTVKANLSTIAANKWGRWSILINIILTLFNLFLAYLALKSR